MSTNTNLGNTPVNQGYVQLIHTGETGGIDGTLRTLYDGDGTAADLQIASDKVKVSTELFIGAKTLTEFIQDTVGTMFTTGNSLTNVSVTYDDANGNIDLSASGEVTLTGSQTLSNKTLASPAFTGDINFTDASTPVFNVTDTTNTVTTKIQSADNSGLVGTSTDHNFGVNRNNISYILLQSGTIIVNNPGNDLDFNIKDSSANSLFRTDAANSRVGILDATPSYTLDVNGTGRFTGALQLDSTLTFDSVALSAIQTSSESFADNDTSLMTSAAINDKIGTEVASLVDSAPGTLNTLNELAAALGDDANFSTTTATNIATKLAKASNLSDLTNASTARANLGLSTGDTSSFLTGDPSMSTSGYIMLRGIVNQTETGSAPAAIVFGNGATYVNDNISLITNGATRIFVNSGGVVDIPGSLTLGTALAVAEGGTGLTSISTLLNSNVTPSSLGLVIGTNVQAYNAFLADIAGITGTGGDGALVGADQGKYITFDFSSAGFILSSSQPIVTSGTTQDGLLTYHSSTTATVESNLTFDGTDLQVGSANADTIIKVAGTRAMFGYDNGNFAIVQGGNTKGIKFNTNTDTFAGSPKMTITTAGDVGIGTESPSANLHIYEAHTAVPELRIDNNNHVMKLQANGTASVIDSTATNTLMVRASGSTKMTILNSGNVGIGTESPAQKLHVYDSSSSAMIHLQTTADANAQVRHQNDNISVYTGVSSADQYVWYHSSLGANAGFIPTSGVLYWNKNILLNNNNTSLVGRETGGTTRSMLKMNTSNEVEISTTSNEIKMNNNVGIGVSPDTKLHIKTTGSGGTSLLKLEDNARLMFLGRDAIAVQDLSGSAAQLYINSNTTFSGSINTGSSTSTFGGAISVTTSITTGYGVAFTNGNTNFLQYNNPGEDVLYMRDTTNGQMLQTWRVSSVDIHRGMTINQDGGNYDTRIESDNNAHMFFVDASANNIAIGTTSADATLHIGDNSSNFLVGSTSGDSVDNLKLESKTNNASQLIFSTERVADGSDWTTTRERIRKRVDTTDMGYIQFGSSFGSNEMVGLGRTGVGTGLSVDGNLNVGVGTTSPASKLHIRNDSAADQLRLGRVDDDSYLSVGAGANNAVYNMVTGGTIAHQFQEDGAALMTIETSGDVGIGTTSPLERLHIYETGLSAYKTYTSAGAGVLITSYQSQGNPYTKTTDIVANSDGTVPSEMRLFTKASGASSASERVRIDSSGNFGIGTTSPGALLTVRKDGTQASSVSTTYQIQTVSDSNGGIAIQAGGTSSAYLVFGDNANYDAGRIQYNNSNNKMNFQTAETTAISIDSSQNVGIGTTSPGRTLQVSGDGVVRLVNDSGDAGIDFNSSDMQLRYRSASDKLQFYSYGTSTNVMTIQKSNGNVGIGTSSPGEKLEVNGSILIPNNTFIKAKNSAGNAVELIKLNSSNHIEIMNGNSTNGDIIFKDAGNTNMTIKGDTGIVEIHDDIWCKTNLGAIRFGASKQGNIYENNNDLVFSVQSAGQDMIFENLNSAGSAYVTNLFIDGSAERVGIGTTSPGNKFTVNSTSANQASIQYDASTRLQISVAGSGATTFTTDNSAACGFTGDVIAFASSDEKLKDNLKPISNSLKKLQKLTGYEFDWNKKQDTYEGHDVGVVAQEVEKVLPEVVTTRDNGYKAVKYEKIVPLLIEAIKEQQQQIEELKNG